MAIKKRSATVVPGASGAAAAVKNPQASKSSFWGELPQHVMSGISRMVPTLIMGGVILAFSQLIAYSWLKIPAEIGIMDALNSGKFSGFDLFFQVFFCFLAKMPVQRYCFFGPRRFDVRWPVALLGLCMKSKLTDYHYLAINFGYR